MSPSASFFSRLGQSRAIVPPVRPRHNPRASPGRVCSRLRQRKSPANRAFSSGRRDSNSGPLVPQTSALTRLRHAPRPRHPSGHPDRGATAATAPPRCASQQNGDAQRWHAAGEWSCRRVWLPACPAVMMLMNACTDACCRLDMVRWCPRAPRLRLPQPSISGLGVQVRRRAGVADGGSLDRPRSPGGLSRSVEPPVPGQLEGAHRAVRGSGHRRRNDHSPDGRAPFVEHRRSRVVAVGAAVGLAVLWLANLALGRPTSYDSGLYHFSAIEYATRFSAIPGLGNLSERLGAGDAHLLFVAALGNGPWHNAGFHLANGLLVALLLADITWRLAAGTTPPFTRRVMLLLLPATFVVVALDPGERLSSPSLDAPAFVLVAAGTLYLCHSLEQFGAGTAMAATAAFATLAATRPYFLPAMIVAAITLVIVSPSRARVLGLISVIPAAVLRCMGRAAGSPDRLPPVPADDRRLTGRLARPRRRRRRGQRPGALVGENAAQESRGRSGVVGLASRLAPPRHDESRSPASLRAHPVRSGAAPWIAGARITRRGCAGAASPDTRDLVLLSAGRPFRLRATVARPDCAARLPAARPSRRDRLYGARRNRRSPQRLAPHHQPGRRSSRLLQPPDTSAPKLHNTERPDHPNTRWR